MRITKWFVAALLLVTVITVSLVPCSSAYREAPYAEEKLQKFLSEVLGIDMAKYNMTNIGSGFNYPLWFSGVVKEEGVNFYLESNDSMISVSSFFDNGILTWLTVHVMNGSIIYARQPPTNALDETRNILQRYQIFAENYAIGTAHLTSAINLLSSVKLSSNATLNMLNNLTGFVPLNATSNSMKMETTATGIKWIYTERGVDMPNKCLVIDFGGNGLFFADTWNLYTVGCFSVISEAEAVEIAFAAAKSYNLTLVGEGGVLIHVQPDWSNMTYTIVLNMIPGQIYTRDPNDHSVNPGSAVRDPLALYPLWESVFYFGKNVGHTVGIAVGVWGDTKEIAYITPYGYLGNTEGNQTAPAATPPESSPSEVPMEPENNSSLNAYLIVGLAIVAIVAAVAAIALRKRSR